MRVSENAFLLGSSVNKARSPSGTPIGPGQREGPSLAVGLEG